MTTITSTDRRTGQDKYRGIYGIFSPEAYVANLADRGGRIERSACNYYAAWMDCDGNVVACYAHIRIENYPGLTSYNSAWNAGFIRLELGESSPYFQMNDKVSAAQARSMATLAALIPAEPTDWAPNPLVATINQVKANLSRGFHDLTGLNAWTALHLTAPRPAPRPATIPALTGILVFTVDGKRVAPSEKTLGQVSRRVTDPRWSATQMRDYLRTQGIRNLDGPWAVRMPNGKMLARQPA